MMDFKKEYPRTYAFLQRTGMTLDQALIWTKEEMKKLEETDHARKGSIS